MLAQFINIFGSSCYYYVFETGDEAAECSMSNLSVSRKKKENGAFQCFVQS